MIKFFALFLFTISFAAFATELDTKADCRGDLTAAGQSRQDADALRRAFIEEFAEMIFADERQNQIWINDALQSLARNDVHVMIENSWMKKLNDKILKNKDFVTALTNYQKVLFLEELGKRAIKLKLDPYQDFKTTRLTLAEPVDAGTLSELEAAFKAANDRFYASPRLVPILRETDLRENWFRMGVGHNENQAALAARHARDHGGKLGISYYWDGKVHAGLETKLKHIKDMHARILARLSDSKLVVTERGWAGLHLDVFAAARKATPEDFLGTLEQMFPGTKLTKSTAKLILNYAELADEFSPSVLVAKREHLVIHDAPHGALSIDFIGLGAENLRGTTKALVKAKDLDHAVKLTRVSEREVTKIFNQRKKMVNLAIQEYFAGEVSMRFSGDDGIIIPGRAVTLRDQLYLVQKLSQLLPRPFFRMAVLNAEGAGMETSSQLITHGESIEKILRQILLRSLGAKRLGEISFSTFIPDIGHFRKVTLIMSGKKDISADEKKILRNSFSTAVKLIEEQVQAQGLMIEYDPNEIFAIFGKRP